MVQLIYRKNNGSSFSIEKVFDTIYPILKQKISVGKKYAGTRSANFIGLIKNLIQFSNTKGEIFHITGDIHYAVFAFPRKKTILTIHDCVFLQNSRGAKRFVFKKLWLDWPVRYVKYITTISEKSKSEIIQYTGCDPNKIIVIPNSVSPLLRERKVVFNEGKPVILFVGTKSNKNLESTIRSLSGIKCRLDIIGRLTSFQIDLLNSENIHYQVYESLTDQEVADRFNTSDMLLFPSLYEGFGLPVIEAQKSGIPVVTSSLSPMNEVAGEGACKVDPNNISAIRNGVLKVINDPGYRSEIVNKGLRNVARFEPEIVAEAYVRLYNSIK